MMGILTFEEAGNGRTNYTARVRHWTVADCEAHEKMGCRESWGIATNQLEAFAQKISARWPSVLSCWRAARHLLARVGQCLGQAHDRRIQFESLFPLTQCVCFAIGEGKSVAECVVDFGIVRQISESFLITRDCLDEPVGLGGCDSQSKVREPEIGMTIRRRAEVADCFRDFVLVY